MKKIMIVLAAFGIALSANAAAYYWGLASYDYLGPDGSGYDTDMGGNFYKGGTAFLYLGTVAYDNGFQTDGATYLTSGGFNEDAFIYGVDNSDFSILPSNAAVDAAGGQAYSIVLVDANVSSLDDSNIQNYIIVNGVSVSDYDPGTEMSAAGLIDYGTVIGGDGVAWTATSSAPPEPIPEPTSGLLVLLGVAGLALKRKKA